MTVCKPCEAHDLKHDRGKKSVTTYSIASVNITLLKYDVLRSVDLWIKGSVKSRAFLLRCDASSPPPSGVSHRLFYPEIPPAQYMKAKL